jgi:hypothetical protein
MPVNLAGWVARTRPLAGPLSPRGPQPVDLQDAALTQISQWADSATFIGTGVVVLGERCSIPRSTS